MDRRVERSKICSNLFGSLPSPQNIKMELEMEHKKAPYTGLSVKVTNWPSVSILFSYCVWDSQLHEFMNPSIFQFVQLELTSGCQVVFCSVFDLRQIRSNPAGALDQPPPRLKPQNCLFLLKQLCHNVPFLRQLPNIAKQSPFKNSKNHMQHSSANNVAVPLFEFSCSVYFHN